MSTVDRVAVAGAHGPDPAGLDTPEIVVRLRGVSVPAPRWGPPLDHVSLAVRAGEMVVAAGPPDSGATTLVRVIAGAEQPGAGRVEIRGRREGGRGPGPVVGAGDLPGDLTVLAAVAELVTAADLGNRIAAAGRLLAAVGLDDRADRRPAELDAGERLRLGVARALAGGTGVVLLDDPLGGADAANRARLRRDLRSLQRALGFAAVCACPRGHEALELADRLAVMSHGRLVQVGEPRAVYDEPVSAERRHVPRGGQPGGRPGRRRRGGRCRRAGRHRAR